MDNASGEYKWAVFEGMPRPLRIPISLSKSRGTEKDRHGGRREGGFGQVDRHFRKLVSFCGGVFKSSARGSPPFESESFDEGIARFLRRSIVERLLERLALLSYDVFAKKDYVLWRKEL